MPVSRSKQWNRKTIAGLVWFHRWLGIATCVIFALWFASGAVLLFQPFPSLSRAAQLELKSAIDLVAVRVAPSTAITKSGIDADDLRLVQRGRTPAYIVSAPAGIVAIDARTGLRLPTLSLSEAEAIGRDALGSHVQTDGPFDYDQWIVHNRFDPMRPFYRLAADDDARSQYYVSVRTGELVQRTTASERGWNWIGAVLHWVYFTPIRSNFTVWDNSVWYLSLVAMLVAAAGTVLGAIRMMAAQRQRKPALTFYRLRWMRWHHLLGLFTSIFVLTYIFSGWLSMDHGRLFSRGNPTAEEESAYRGQPMVQGLAGLGTNDLRAFAGAREIDFSVVAGQPMATASYPGGALRRITSHGLAFGQSALLRRASQGAHSAWGGSSQSRVLKVPPSDIYALAEGWPVTATILIDPAGTRPDICIDAADGRILTVMSFSRKAYAWVYYGLHTLNFPGLADRPLVRESLVLLLMLAGFAFSATGIVIGWQRLRKTI